jgi:hypothetical protein
MPNASELARLDEEAKLESGFKFSNGQPYPPQFKKWWKEARGVGYKTVSEENETQ